jgi:aspartate kinase
VALIVQKYGGTSVGDPDRIRNVARRVVETVKAGHRVAVVVSAMSGQTDRLVALARDLGGEDPDPREYDQIVSTGEQITIALLAMAIQRLGQPARSFTGFQMGMRTDTAYTRARIESIDTEVLRQALDRGQVAVLAGFQGIDMAGNVTCTRRIRASFRPRASSSASPTRRCSRWRAWARRCSRSARCASRCATACRCTCVPRSTIRPAPGWCRRSR